MKYILLGLLLFFASNTRASEPLRIGVITDLHYLSEKLMDNGLAVNNYMQSSARMIKYTPKILDSVLNHFNEGCADDVANIDILLVCGDMTKDGERQSHLDFVAKLKVLQEKGVQVFVIPGNHDINMPNSVGYKGDETYKVDNVSPDQFVDIYKDCGYSSAFKRDTASLSYVSLIHKHYSTNKETWLLAIDAARYNEYKDHSISGGKISPQTEKWIMDVLAEASAKNAQVIGMMHWGLTEHITYQGTYMKDYLVDDWQRLSTLFADNGMKAIFTGHCHANDITMHASVKGNKIYDIETGSLTSFPFAYRMVDYYPSNMNISTFNIESIPSNPKLFEESKGLLLDAGKKMIKRKMEGSPYMFTEKLDLQLELLAQLFVLHMQGDETMTKELRELARQFMGEDNISDEEIEGFEIDLFPADNNVTIVF